MMVDAEPILLAQASPIRKGIGFSEASMIDTQMTGVKAKQTMSFARSAERRADVNMSDLLNKKN